MKKSLPTIAFYLVFAFAISPTINSCTEDEPLVVTGNIEGTVRDTETNATINGVIASLTANGSTTFEERSKATGSDGKFRFRDIAAGSYKISFEMEGYDYNSKNITCVAGQTSSSDVRLIRIKPILSVLITSLDFGTSETSKAFQIKNNGKWDLNWEVQEDIDWLSVNPKSGTTGTESSSVTVTINRADIVPGTYDRTISITSNGGTTEIQIKASQEGPVLQVSSTTLDFESDIITKTLQINNSGAGILEYTLISDETWISISPNSGEITSETGLVDISVNRSGLEYGNYTGTVNIVTNGGNEIIDIQMTYADPNVPQLSLSPIIINFGTNESSGNLTITNTGNGILEWNLNDNQDWITVDKNSGTLNAGESTIVIVTADRFGLAPNNYEGFINVSSNGGTETCNIHMEIPSEPILFYEPTELGFGHDEETMSFTIKNIGTGSLDWNLSTNKDWISLSEIAGTNLSSIYVTVDRTTLDYGVYSGQVSINSNGGTEYVAITAEKRMPNTPPVVDFSVTPASGYLETNFALIITCSDDYTADDNLLLRWKWEDVDTYTEWSNTKTDSHTFTTSGTKDITVQVKDEDEEITTLTKSVEVYINQEPTASFTVTPETGTINTEFSVDASNCSDDSTSKENLQIRWQWEDNADFTSWTTNKTATHIYTIEGSKIITLEVKDEQGLISSTSTTFDVFEPVLFYEPSALDFGTDEVSMSFELQNTGTGDLKWELSTNKDWIGVNDTIGTNLSTINVTVDRTGLDYGNYSGQISISSNGGTGVVVINMVYMASNNAPIVDFTVSPLTGFIDTNFDLIITCSDDYTAEDNLLLRWKWEDVDTYTEWSNTKTDSHTFTTSGTKNITVQVKDEDEEITTLTKSVEVYINQEPTASFTVTPATGTINTEFSVDASNCSDDYTSKENLQIRWQWEDNAGFFGWTTSKTATHTYSISGNKTITLEVKDEAGLISSTTNAVILQDGETEPNNSISQAQSISLNSEVIGDIGYGDDDVDYYTFTPTENGVFSFSIKNLHSSGITDGTIGSSSLYEYGESSKTGTYNIGVADTKISSAVTVSKDKQYIIRIPKYSDNMAPYELTTVFTASSQTDTDEPNNYDSQASAVSLNGTIAATIGYTDDDVDYYTFTPTENGIFSFSIKNLHSSGITDGTVGSSSLYEYGESSKTGTYNIGVADTKISSTVTVSKDKQYIIRIPKYSDNMAPYELTTVFTASSQTDTGEPNNYDSQASAVSLNGTIAATIGYTDDDVDYYTFTPTEDGTFSFSIKNLHSSGITDGTVGSSSLYEYGESSKTGTYNIGVAETKSSSTVTVSKDKQYIIRIPKYSDNMAPYELTTAFQ